MSLLLFQAGGSTSHEPINMETYLTIAIIIVVALLVTVVLMIVILLSQRRLIHDLANELTGKKLSEKNADHTS